MLDVGLPPWRVAPSRRVFKPSSLFSLKTRPKSFRGRLRRRSSSGRCLPSFSIAVFRLRFTACRLFPSCLTPELDSFLWTAAALLTLTPLGLLVFSCLRLVALRHDCAWPPIGAGSCPLVFTLLLSPSPDALFRSRAPLPFVASYRPCPSCDGVQLSHAAERAQREFVPYP